MFKILLYFYIIINMKYSIECKMEHFIVGGNKAKITQFPHSVFIAGRCVNARGKTLTPWVCGGSIINEKIILTAAHCLAGCVKGSVIHVFVGHEKKFKGTAHRAHNYILHERYNDSTMFADLALMNLKTRLNLNKNVKRIVLMREPPYTEEAQVAGWGYIDELNYKSTKYLWYITQHVRNKEACKEVLPNLPEGCICAHNGKSTVYSSQGDSGSALVVRGYIQIGIVSFKMDSPRSLIIYTDTGFFYNWIRTQAKRLYCTGP